MMYARCTLRVVFSKSKLTPVPSKTLHSLEILAVYWDYFVFFTLISDVNFSVAVSLLNDSQIALSSILTR